MLTQKTTNVLLIFVTELLKRQFCMSLQMNIRLSKIAIDIAFAKSVISIKLIVNTVI